MNIPPMVYVIGVLGVVWLIVRVMAQRADARRQEEREERMARLMEERERMLAADDPPSSLGAVVSDSSPPTKNERGAQSVAKLELPDAKVKVRCRKCRELNDEEATSCSSCGEPL